MARPAEKPRAEGSIGAECWPAHVRCDATMPRRARPIPTWDHTRSGPPSCRPFPARVCSTFAGQSRPSAVSQNVAPPLHGRRGVLERLGALPGGQPRHHKRSLTRQPGQTGFWPVSLAVCDVDLTLDTTLVDLHTAQTVTPTGNATGRIHGAPCLSCGP